MHGPVGSLSVDGGCEPFVLYCAYTVLKQWCVHDCACSHAIEVELLVCDLNCKSALNALCDVLDLVIDCY